MKNPAPEPENLEVFGARVHNLRNIDVLIPRNRLVVITGLSGSGKSSLAFDTIHAEGQRRYMESFSAYARQFLGSMERPDVDKITGLSPVISIEQKTTNTNPRSTVGTITEVYDFLRLLFARAGEAFSYVTGEKMVRLTDDQILSLILKKFDGKKVTLLAPLVKGRKGHYRELFEQAMQWGYLRMRINGSVQEIRKGMQADRYKTHDIEMVIDRMTVEKSLRPRIAESMAAAIKYGKGSMLLLDDQSGKTFPFSRQLMCPVSGISYEEPAPNTFSFNSPYGACKKCNGLGTVSRADIKTIIPDPKKNIRNGGIAPLGVFRDSWIFSQIEILGKKFGFTLSTPVGDISEEALNVLLYGTDEMLTMTENSASRAYTFDGIVNFIVRHYQENASAGVKKWAENFMETITCPECNGTRLKKEALWFKIAGKSIADLVNMDLSTLHRWIGGLDKKLDKKQKTIAQEVIGEIEKRISFMLDVGLRYLSLGRTTRSLSGGEAQRIRLATQIGSQLTGVLYILDEPSIGLHQRDNVQLLNSLRHLRDIGNSVIVVEHDRETILASDYIIDLGPGAGIHGGHIVAAGPPKELLTRKTLTAQYLSGVKSIHVPPARRKGNKKFLTLKSASGNNLKDVTLRLPLGKLICITGVSGSGKSSLISETLYPILSKHFYRSEIKPLPYRSIEGLGNLDKVIEIDQSPIGRTPRSNPSTYTGIFTDIRTLFASLPESKIRGYTPGRFSFNVKGGRCETCQGGGMRLIEMNFLPDVYVACETCGGKRYNRETLEVRYRGKSISDVLSMSVEDAAVFFENLPSVAHKIQTLNEVGLGYITLGQSSTTLSGGEAQRVKLATELSKKDTGNTFYILDEPTTGLHFEDIRILMEVLNRLVDKGNTVLVIEHNMDVIKMADHIVDMGPEGGADGGQIIAEGTPEEICRIPGSITGGFLHKELIALN